MNIVILIVMGIIALMLLLGLSRALLRYWEDQVQLTDEHLDLEHRVKELNDRLANQRPDDEIVRILSGQEKPTLGRTRRKK